MRFFNLVLPLLAFTVGGAALADAQIQASPYNNVGRTPTDEEVRAWDIAIGTDGKELPPGSGTAKQGAKIFSSKCAVCHGANLEGSQLAPRLVGGEGTLTTLHPVMTVGNYFPFATTVWDYIHRAMPRFQEGTLGADDVYSLTAYLLYRNNIIKETDAMDATSLPKVQMPNRYGFVPPDLGDIHDYKKRGCRLGNCP
jgi:mono/diheme cytochrome c family protein